MRESVGILAGALLGGVFWAALFSLLCLTELLK